jgi:hypothetical protein
MLRGISNSGPFGQAKPCVTNAFDINYLLFADEVMANILHLAQNMDEDAGAPSMPAPSTLPPLPSVRLSLLVAVRTTAEDTTHVDPVAAVASRTSAEHVAVWTTSCPPALPEITPF